MFSIVFKQNEGGFLAGLIAAGTVQAAELPGQETSRRAGVIVGAGLPVIQDFVVGFEAGWEAGGGAPSDLLVQYVGGNQPFADPARAKDIANSMFGPGAAIVWPVAGASSSGVFEAAVDHGVDVIGIDADQALSLSNAEQRAVVVTSILKNVGVALLEAFDRETRDDLPYGQTSSLGLRESAVGIVDNDDVVTGSLMDTVCAPVPRPPQCRNALAAGRASTCPPAADRRHLHTSSIGSPGTLR